MRSMSRQFISADRGKQEYNPEHDQSLDGRSNDTLVGMRVLKPQPSVLDVLVSCVDREHGKCGETYWSFYQESRRMKQLALAMNETVLVSHGSRSGTIKIYSRSHWPATSHVHKHSTPLQVLTRKLEPLSWGTIRDR